MSVDLQQFHEVFFEESKEHLDDMEQGLMAIDVTQVDNEVVNAVFRAAHSIKGGSGIFGFDALARVTHHLESLLDLARKHQLELTKSLIDQFLSTTDLLRGILQAYRDKQPQDDKAIAQVIDKLEQLLQANHVGAQSGDNDQGFGFFKDENSPVCEDDSFGFFAPSGSAELSPETTSTLPSDSEGTKHVDAATTISSQRSDTLQHASAEGLPAKSKLAESSTIRVDTTKVDNLVNMVGELVITQSMLSLVGAQLEGALAQKLQTALMELDRNTREIQDAVMSIRMLPISFVFNRFPRLVRDLSGKLGKDIELVIEGGNTEIDKSLIEQLADPLTHLVRNSIDHGIELPQIREASGKPSKGTVILKAQHRGGNIQISIIDDGAGLNKEKILHKARTNNIDVSDNPTEQQIWQLIFAPGFSTADAITDVSGRGVGMDVVKRNITNLGGSVDIESTAGKGAAFHISLPLTLAILDGMGVSVGSQIFIIPLVNIIESIQPRPEQLKSVRGSYLVKVRDEYWPLIMLNKVMEIAPAAGSIAQSIIVLVESNQRRFGIVVDALEGQHQAVIKSLEKHYKKVAGLAGATIMGDGSVALILDIESLSNWVEQTEAEELS